eukprot:CAMPEP_0198263626 /NCGR_PEP_ID=MMETSP1447-20131203/12916_1 /TAXON_ID=420782 /ORGANISM="Chaetoceros dichaeta, Strain CCMP1751" /LENGTH=267 /DNA_ID=CAMNT_0043952309 /DNA_START=108 /DNA_END=911 /DNA_ORIENTATION=+
MRAATRLVIILQFLTYASLCLSLQTSTTRIQVCQNKDCQKRFQKFSSSENLVQTFSDLLPPFSSSSVTVESTGCLGQCGQGPNVSISRSSSEGRMEKIFGSVDDGMMASAILEVGGGIEAPDLLLIAVEGIGRSTRVTSPEKKIKILTPVITSLLSDEKSNSLDKSTALAHALVLRADAYLEQALLSPGSSSNSNTIHEAHTDAQMAISINHLDGRAYRVLADAEEALGNVIGAMDAVSKWAEVNPSFGTKARKELARLASAGSSAP